MIHNMLKAPWYYNDFTLTKLRAFKTVKLFSQKIVTFSTLDGRLQPCSLINVVMVHQR